MDFDRQVKRALMRMGQSPYFSSIEEPLLSLWRLEKLSPDEAASRLCDFRKRGFNGKDLC
jgi:hypothetical protein